MKRKDDLHPLELMADGVSRSGVNLIDVVDLPYGPMGVEIDGCLNGVCLASCSSAASSVSRMGGRNQ